MSLTRYFEISDLDRRIEKFANADPGLVVLFGGDRFPASPIREVRRWMRKPDSYDSIEEALGATAAFYRKALWKDADEIVEVWLEKDALAGVIYSVTAEYDVPLMVARGFSSETFCFEAIEAREGDPRPYDVWYLGDFDRSGRDAAKALKEKLERFGAEKGVDVSFTILAFEEGDLVEFDESDLTALVNLHGESRWLPARMHKRNQPPTRHGRTRSLLSSTRSSRMICAGWCAR